MTFAARQREGGGNSPPDCVYKLTIQLPITIIATAADDVEDDEEKEEAANYGLTCEIKYTQRGAHVGISSIRMEVMCTMYYMYYIWLYLRPT